MANSLDDLTPAELLRHIASNADCLDEDSAEQIVYIHNNLKLLSKKVQDLLSFEISGEDSNAAQEWLKSF